MKELREDLRLAGLLLKCLFPVGKARLAYMPLYVASAVIFTLGLAYFGLASPEPQDSSARHPFETAPTALVAVPKESLGDSGLDMLRSAPLPLAASLPPPEPEPQTAAAPPRPADTDWSKTLTLAKEPPPAAPERPAFKLVSMPAPASSKATSSVVLMPAPTQIQAVDAARPAAAAARNRPQHRARQFRDRKGRYYDR